MGDSKPAVASDHESTPLLSRPLPPRRKPVTVFLGLLATLSVVAFFHLRPSQEDLHQKPAQQWTWNDIKPSRDLVWTKCYDDKFDCARLDVPMDWIDPSEHQRVQIGVIRLPAKNKDSRLPPVFTNPGGPGGSGLQYIKQVGEHIQTIVGDNHDIIGFDPRGIGVSTPRVECWGSSQKRRIWSLQATPLVDERPGLEYDAYARATAYIGACETAMNDTGLLQHLGTASHARDMLEILDKTGHEKLRYWGVSYGTILGGVFAGLYPDRVERLVSDGNCDYHDWFKLDRVNFVQDADKIMDAFDTECARVGKEKCALWSPTAQEVQNRRAALLESLKKSPVIVPEWIKPTGPEVPELVTYTKLQFLTQSVLYKPQQYFGRMAAIYEALERGDGVPYYEMAVERDSDEESAALCTLGDTPATMPIETGAEIDAFPAIMCSDNDPVLDTPEEFVEYIQRLKDKSRWAGAFNNNFRMLCLGKTVRPKWFFDEQDIRGKTAHPILFIGNMADNVTPYESALNNSARFPGSVVLKQNSFGHCTLAAASACTARHIRAYFQDGTLPLPGTECNPDKGLFDMVPDQHVMEYEDDKDELVLAMIKLARDGNAARIM